MSNESKLLKLLTIAVENGWKPSKNNMILIFLKDPSVIVWNIDCEEFTLNIIGGFHTVTFNNLVTNWEEGEVSFIQALCRATEKVKSDDFKIKDWESSFITSIDFYFVYEELKFLWNFKLDEKQRIDKRPTSKRLDWLFETFSHLLNE